MFKKLNLQNIKNILKEIITRFPLAVIASIVTFILIGYQISVDNISYILEDTLFKIIVSTIAVFFLSSSFVLIGSFNFPFMKAATLKGGGIIFQLISILFGLLFYFSFSPNSYLFFSEQIIYIFLIFIGIISFLFISAFIKKLCKDKYIQDSYYNYFIKIVAIFCMSFILGGALTLLGFIGLGSIFTLFDLNSIVDEGDYYGYFANFSLIVFTPIFFLSQLLKEHNDKKLISLNGFFKFLLKYIAIPFIYIYFIILYAYTVKVLLNFNEWPHGEVSWMVIGFSLFGYLIYIFSYGIEKENTYIKTFRKYFPYVVFPQIFMLFYAIYLRINQYDFTINRYFVVVFGICLIFISLYLILLKYKRLIYIQAILFTFIILISIGPWSVFNFPESRQINILDKYLIEANILQDGKIVIVEDKGDIEDKISGKIYDLIGYLVQNHGIESLENIFPDIIKEIEEEDKNNWIDNRKKSDNDIDISKYRGISSWEYIFKLRDKLKVEAYFEKKNAIREQLFYGIDYNEGIFPLDVSGYDYLTKIYSNKYNLENEGVNNKTIALIDINDKELILSKGNEVLDTVNIESILNTILSYSSEYFEKQSRDEMTFEINSDKYDFKLFIQNISLRNPDYIFDGDEEEFKIISSMGYNTSGYILVRKK